MALLVVWVAALQLMLDEGKNLDWFASTQIVTLAVIAAFGFAAFLIWELHEPHRSWTSGCSGTAASRSAS